MDEFYAMVSTPLSRRSFFPTIAMDWGMLWE